MSLRIKLLEPGFKNLSVRRQCELLSVNRNKLYYKPVGESQENLKFMLIIDKHLMEHPAEGVLSMVNLLHQQGYQTNPKRIRRLFRMMGRQAIYRRKNLTKLGQAAYIKPYLLRGLKIERPGQVWCTDISYIPMQKGFMYLTAVLDVYSRKIVGWGLSNSMDAEWCLDVLKEAIMRHGKPEIVNSDQGSQYTSALWTTYLSEQGIKVSMDGKGRANDNTWIERFWKTIKYNYIYLNPAGDGLELLYGVDKFIKYYHGRIHQTTKQTPNERYQSALKVAA